MMFVDTVRRFQKEYPFEQAMEQAIDECIRTGILSDFLRKSRAEVMRMWLFEYDQEKHLKDTYEEGVEDGIEIGEAHGEKRGIEIGEKRGMDILNRLTQSLLNDNRIADLSRSTKDADYREQLLKEYKLI